jgi:PleD family two-component response regulator
MEITRDLTAVFQGELCDDLAMLYALENGGNSIITEPFTINDEE